MQTKYPIYIISKGRHDTRLTSKALERMNVDYRIVIEPQEYDLYAAVINPIKILTLPFSNLGQGSIPARNWVWEHSISEGATSHWIVDDNIKIFTRLNNNRVMEDLTGGVFLAIESLVDRYENVALAGPHYQAFAKGRTIISPVYLNRRVYSCTLINNSLPYRWRGRYNEDTDLSLRALKDGWCTMLFYAFLINKATTMTIKGGNTDELYQGDGRLKMAQSLVAQHPDVTTIIHRWGRYQHHVDYRPFKNNRLKLKPDAVIEHGVNNFGMVLKTVDKVTSGGGNNGTRN